MNVVSKVRAVGDGSKVLHAINAYDLRTDELVAEYVVPASLDGAVLRVAGVPTEDVAGVVSYPLAARQVETVASLLGFDADLSARTYVLEALEGTADCVPPKRG